MLSLARNVRNKSDRQTEDQNQPLGVAEQTKAFPIGCLPTMVPVCGGVALLHACFSLSVDRRAVAPTQNEGNHLSRSALVDADISNPIPLSAQETRPVILALKIGSLRAQAGKIKVFKCVDVYDGVDSIINLTCDNRHRTTASTNVKYCGLRSK
jgi:hypothetical protein